MSFGYLASGKKLLDPLAQHKSSQFFFFFSHTEKGHLILIYSLHPGKLQFHQNK